jgi:hypothetical protein
MKPSKKYTYDADWIKENISDLNCRISSSLIIKCECGAESLEIKKEDDMFEVSLWRLGRVPLMSIKERIRWCWHILRNGYPWTDSIILTNKNAKMISDYIDSNL